MIIRIVSAIGGGVLDLEVSPNTSIAEVKREISIKKKIPASAVLIVFHGREIEDNETVEQIEAQDYDKLYLIARTEGG